MSTKAELRAAVKREARIKSSNNLDSLVDEIITDILRDHCNKARYYELLKERVGISLVDEQQAYALPDDFQNLEVVYYGRGPNPTTTRIIDLQPASVKQTWFNGIPRFYRMVAGPKISLWPYGSILAMDQLQIDYYVDPASLFVDDSDNFPIPRLESAVKKDAIARVQRFHAASQEAQIMDADGQASFNAAQSATK